LIDYNYLDLVSKVTFADGTTVETFYTSTGERRQRKVTKNGVTSYTLYDGEMVYQFTGNVTSLNDYKVSEIQNPEGRFVGGKLEYGYTDHVGNLRLSYKDSLGVAFITQSQSYDPWSNVNAGSEYQLSGIQGDRYLVSGKENDNLTGNILLDWRDYDSVTGRMNSYDPADQSMSMSGFAYCGNNPVMKIDPDGRFAFMPFLMMTLFSGHISGMISQSNGGSYGKGFLTGAATSAIGGGIGAGMAGILGQAGTFGGAFLRGAVGGAVSGGISGGVGSMMNGGNFGDGFLGGAVSGGISGGIMGGLTFNLTLDDF
jgi:RHS repeat-associated protein